MHVLVVPATYPSRSNPLPGVFFRDHALALARGGLRVGVAVADPRRLARGSWGGVFDAPFRIKAFDDEGLDTFAVAYPSVPKMPRMRVKLWLRQADRVIQRYVGERGVPDVIHAHGLLWAGVAATQPGVRRWAPVMVTAHYSNYALGLMRRWQEERVRAALGAADGVYAVSRALAQELERRWPGLDIGIIPNLVDAEHFSLAARSESDDFRWLWIAGGISEEKGADILLQAFALGFRDQPGVSLRIAGVGDRVRSLVGQAKRLGVEGQVSFGGRLDRAGVVAEMHAAHGLVSSSRVETFGVVLIEAMATGLPVVSTASGGPNDIVGSEVGTLVAADDPPALAAAMVSLYENRSAWWRRAPDIRRYTVDRYGEQAVVEATLGAYKRLIAAGRTS